MDILWHHIATGTTVLKISILFSYQVSFYYPGTGYCFRSISLFVSMYLCIFVSLFVSLLARLRENGWTDVHEIFREGAEWTWDDVIQFLFNSEKPHDAAMRNTGTAGRGLLCFCTTASFIYFKVRGEQRFSKPDLVKLFETVGFQKHGKQQRVTAPQISWEHSKVHGSKIVKLSRQLGLFIV